MTIIGFIPARMASTRLPGKPLMQIAGKPLIWYVFDRARHVCDHVIVATPDEEIVVACGKYHIQVCQTRTTLTGTDCIAQVAATIDFRSDTILVNIQGDEPLVDPASISKVASLIVKSNFDVVNGVARISKPREILNPNVVKAVVEGDRLLWLSRSPVPYGKSIAADYYRQLGLYAFKPSTLASFTALKQPIVETVEGVEILRFLASGYSVGAVECESGLAVDTIEDFEQARELLE